MAGSREKPVCAKCGEQHWMFVRCAEAPAENAADIRRLHEREGTLVQAPISRAQTRPAVFVGRNFVEQAPGVYRRRRRP